MAASKKRQLRILTDRFEIIPLQRSMVNDRFMSWMTQIPIGRQFPQLASKETREELLNFIEKKSGTWQFFIVKEKDVGAEIGFIVVIDGPANSVTTHHALGERDWWGRGVIHEARAGLIEALFQVGVHKIVGIPRASSRGAVSAYHDQGFVQEGVLRDRHYNDDGTYDDAIAFGLLREDWNFNAASQMPEAILKRQARLKKRRSIKGVAKS